LGEDYLKNLGEFDVLLRTPGLPVKRVDEALVGLERQPVRTSVTDLFLVNASCTTIGVTGTKGKGTTSTLIASLLTAAGRKVVLAGNIGMSIFDSFDDLTSDNIVVLELSSFQLEDVTHSPNIAVILPITEDHLRPLSEKSPNYHETLADYAAAKGNLTAFQDSSDLLFFAEDSPTTAEIASHSLARKIGVGSSDRADLKFTTDGKIFSDGQEIIDLQESGLRGEHIFLDATLALAVAREFGATVEQLKAGFRNFQPLPHRLQKIAEIDGVTYYDDSYATMPDAAIFAINSFSEPVIWIGGGSTKGADFSELAKVITKSSIKQAILLGQEASRIKSALEVVNFTGQIDVVGSIAEVVTLAKKNTQWGDVVLLSPACASKDMFVDAADRGQQFTDLILNGSNTENLRGGNGQAV
jgi:UDP-N-acetylmuramoylalanine--D-glutamate ligase